MKTLNDANKKDHINLSHHFLFRYAAEMGDGLKCCEGLITNSFVSFAKVHITESIVAVYVARAMMDSDLTKTADTTEATGKLVLLYNQKEKKFRLFKNSMLFDILPKAELSKTLTSGLLAPLSFEDVIGMASASGRGDMSNVFTQKFPGGGMDKFISEDIVSRITHNNAYTVIDEELLLPAIIKELERLRYCTLSLKRFSSPVVLEPSSSWEEEVARRWLISTLNPQFPCFNLFNSLKRYRRYIQRQIKELEQQYFEKGIVEVKFYDVFGVKRTFHAVDDLDNTEIEVYGTWNVACDLDMCCVSPAEQKFLKEFTYTKDGDESKSIIPWGDIISVTGKDGKRHQPQNAVHHKYK